MCLAICAKVRDLARWLSAKKKQIAQQLPLGNGKSASLTSPEDRCSAERAIESGEGAKQRTLSVSDGEMGGRKLIFFLSQRQQKMKVKVLVWGSVLKRRDQISTTWRIIILGLANPERYVQHGLVLARANQRLFKSRPESPFDSPPPREVGIQRLTRIHWPPQKGPQKVLEKDC